MSVLVKFNSVVTQLKSHFFTAGLLALGNLNIVYELSVIAATHFKNLALVTRLNQNEQRIAVYFCTRSKKKVILSFFTL